jgi:hypothetical protein
MICFTITWINVVWHDMFYYNLNKCCVTDDMFYYKVIVKHIMSHNIYSGYSKTYHLSHNIYSGYSKCISILSINFRITFVSVWCKNKIQTLYTFITINDFKVKRCALNTTFYGRTTFKLLKSIKHWSKTWIIHFLE